MQTSSDLCSAAIDYARKHRPEFLESLCDLLRIPSVSTLPEHRLDVEAAGDWTENYLRRIGITDVRRIPTPGFSVVFGQQSAIQPDAPTLLIYGHYDVQPVDPIDQWRSDPFDPVIQGDDIFARGVSDDKGQFLAMLTAVECCLKAVGSLPINIKILIEGEEEISSPNLSHFIDEHRDLITCDAVVIADQTMFSNTEPSICYAVRGGCYMQIDVRGPAVDFHSGTVGGAIANPFNVLVRMLAQCQSADHRITVPGFYDDVIIPDANERALLARSPVTDDLVKHFTGVPEVAGEPEFSSAERLSIRPTFEIHGMPGGFTGEGKKSLIPSIASAKISFRLVPKQDPVKIASQVEAFLQSLAPPSVIVSCRRSGHSFPTLVDRFSPAVQAADRAYQAAFGHPAVYFRAGGSLPIVHDITMTLGVPVAMIGFGLPDDRPHGPNEKLHLPNFHRGIEMAIHYFYELSRCLQPRPSDAQGR
jgi:acetylornithine deacetylase/succinyl-diaminopimelate desuccinylase-like protein